MNTPKLNGKDLLTLGFPEGKAIGTALSILEGAYKGKTREHKLELLGRVLESPALYKEHAILAPLAADLLAPKVDETIALNPEKVNYTIYGGEGIEAGALNQMEIAMRLPVAKAGALMPTRDTDFQLAEYWRRKMLLSPMGLGWILAAVWHSPFMIFRLVLLRKSGSL